MSGLLTSGVPYLPPQIQGPNSGLLGPLQPGINPSLLGQNSRIAYGLAGNPSMGPFASVAPPPTQPYTLGNTTGPAGGAAGGLLGTAAGLLQDYKLGKTGLSALQGLFGPSMDAYASGSVGNAALQGAVNAGGGTPALTNSQLGLTSGGGVPGGDSGGAAAGGDAAAAAGAVGAGGLLGGGGAGAGAVTITDAAGNVLAGEGAAGGIGTAAGTGASGAAAGSAGSGAASSGAVGAANVALPAFLGYELYSGLTSGSVNPLLGTNLGPESQAWTNDWLNNSGPGLQFISGTGSADSPLTVNLKNGTQISGDQYQKLQDMMKGFVLDNKSNGMFTDQKPLTDAQSKQLSDYLTSVSTQQPASNAGYGQPTPSSTPTYSNLTAAQLQQMQNYYAQMGGR